MVRAGDDRKILKTNSLPFDAELDEIEERCALYYICVCVCCVEIP